MNKTQILTFFILLISGQSLGQEKDSLTSKYLSLGLGVPYWNFREAASSSLSYSGFGLGEINISKLTLKENKSIKKLNLFFGLGFPSPSIENKTDWNLPSEVDMYHLSYSYLKHLKTKSKFNIYLGAKISSDGQMIFYPTINNSITYNFNWLSIHPTAIIMHNFKVKKTNTRLQYQFSIPIISFNSRPNSYIGLLPNNLIWSQDKKFLNVVTDKITPTSIHNNLMVQSSLCWHILTKKNKIKLSYNWLLQHNTVSDHSFTFVKSSFIVSYLIPLNKTS